MTNRFSIALASAAAAALAAAAVAGCSSSDASSNATQSGNGVASTLRLGYFPNVTHAVPVLGVDEGLYAKALGKTKLETQTFNAGPAATQALLSGAIDAVYVGPNPAINAYSKSNGEAVRLIAGGASGGAGLVVNSKINSVSDLAGKTIATPQLGGTQDIAAKYYLKQQGFTVNGSGAKNVTIVAQDNAQTLDLFKQGRIDGGWLPEPWLTRLVVQGGGHVLVDEKTQWPGGQFITTNLLVSTKFLKQYPQTVKDLLEGQVDTVDWINANQSTAATDLDAALKKLTGKALPAGVAAKALSNVTLGWDPYASSLQTVADHAVDVGLLKKTDLKGIYDLTLLNEVLKAKGKPEVSDAGLGQK
ncbi:NitT/TauT family transport system substrate-binding protein [Branchiibius hedensis]|uniref:NitT/TauT family transport system substrate-binding protein n=1 Tax=Branchiibius hedensis TaxID=672460 RepID=A0A2Y8ZQF4_9MICO|nr:ABC transporter substrate-binding protein [Branchiibius hedensis]PWJ25777.1 NitT/TauT family transport system substrate-binding protein [Branchiibius hedensis]SSA34590.1 NitT/TauT family transport system substrate-binding protein [Branchiibius hedensis]